MSQPAPGWYPDPAGTSRLRWWNGGMWTEQFQPMPAQQGMPSQGAPPASTSAPDGGMGASPVPNGAPLPANQQAPAVSSALYSPDPASPQLPDSGVDAPGAYRGAAQKKSGSKWLIGAIASWVAVGILLVSSLIAGAAYKASGEKLSQAENDRASAQTELDSARSELDQAKQELEEAQK